MLEQFERYPLTFGPTPIERLDRLSEYLGGQVEIHAKREDCNSGLAFGGNKIRKLEYLVPDILANDAIRLCARLEGMMTDPVYEGKSMQGLIDLVRKGFIPAGSKVLYAHLGGVPAINAYSYLYRDG